MASRAVCPQWRVCVLLTERLCVRPWREVLLAALRGGADCIQVREKELRGTALVGRTKEVLALARPFGACVVVNDDADAALEAGADGVHVGQGDRSPEEVRRMAGDALWIGVSTHSVAEAEAAVAANADVCGVGAMFPTGTKPGIEPSGVTYLREYLHRFGTGPRAVAHLAIGGITPQNIAALAAAGCRGVAVSGVVCGAADPAQVVAALRSVLDDGAGAR